MASTSMSSVLFLILATFAAVTSAATFAVKNNCSYTVWPAAIPISRGTQLDPGWTWTVDVPAGTTGRFWGRTSCSFNGGAAATATPATALAPSTAPSLGSTHDAGQVKHRRYREFLRHLRD